MTRALTTLGVASLLALLASCQWKLPQASAAGGESLRVPAALVRVVSPTLGPIQKRIRATGNIEPRQYADIMPELSGKVLEVRARLRTPVHKGDTLAIFDSQEQEMTYSTAVEKARRLAAEKKRNEDLFSQSRLGQDALDQARHLHTLAMLDESRALLTLQRSSVLSPLDGVVTFEDIRPGEILATRRIFRVEDLTNLMVKVHIPERDLPDVTPGDSVQVFHFTQDTPYSAEVGLIAPTLDPNSGTGEVQIFIHPGAAERLRVGYFVQNEIIVENRPQVLLIPKRAILREPGGNFVVLAVKRSAVAPGIDAPGESVAVAPSAGAASRSTTDWVAQRVRVEIGLEDAVSAEIKSGFESFLERGGVEDLSIVVEGQFGILDGTALRLIP